jgi:hypothetical protein
VGATHLSFADAIKLHNTVALRLLSLPLSVSDFIVADPIPCEESWAMYAGGLETHNRGRRFFTRSFFRRRGKARTEENRKKAAENFLSLATFGMGIRSSISPDASANQTQRARERSLLQGQLSNPFLISYATKAQKRLMMFKPETQRLVMIKPFDDEAWRRKIWMRKSEEESLMMKLDGEERLMMELEKDYWWWRLKTRTIV